MEFSAAACNEAWLQDGGRMQMRGWSSVQSGPPLWLFADACGFPPTPMTFPMAVGGNTAVRIGEER